MQNYQPHNKKVLSVNRGKINRATNIVLVILWVGTVVLLGTMIFRWYDDGSISDPWNSSGKELLIDDMLLSSEDLKFYQNSSLINVTLYQPPATGDQLSETESQKTEATRKVIYNNILKRKLRDAQKESSGGFTIKPLPE